MLGVNAAASRLDLRYSLLRWDRVGTVVLYHANGKRIYFLRQSSNQLTTCRERNVVDDLLDRLNLRCLAQWISSLDETGTGLADSSPSSLH
jgi:hypothetical protein